MDWLRTLGVILGSAGILLHVALLAELRYRRRHDLPVFRTTHD